MKITEKGIIISRTSYSESSLIVHLLTENGGYQSFLFQGAKKKGVILFPLAPVEFTYYKRNDSELGKITDLQQAEVLSFLPFDPVKSGLAFFIAELIQRTIHQGHAEKQLFEFIFNEVIWINHSSETSNYLSWFLAQYSRLLGVTPSVDEDNSTVFDIRGGKLSTVRPLHPAYFEGNWVSLIEASLSDEKNNYLAKVISKADRNKLFDAWLAYFQHHLHGMRELKSVEVIKTVLYT